MYYHMELIVITRILRFEHEVVLFISILQPADKARSYY